MAHFSHPRELESFGSDPEEESWSDDGSLLSPTFHDQSYLEFMHGLSPSPATGIQDEEVSQELFTDSMVAAASSVSVLDPSPTPLPSITTPAPATTYDWDRRGSTTVAAPFDDTQSGWNVPLTLAMNELDYWRIVFPPEVLAKLVTESNAYAAEIIGATENPSRRQRNFKEITEPEMLRYLVIRILMGIDEKPELAHYWSTDPFLRSMIIPQIMSSDRFFEIQRYLHFCGDEEESDEQQRDKLHKIRAIWEMATSHFKTLLVPYGSLSVDESLTKFRGRLIFRQFIPIKRNRFGVKSYSVVDEKTKFLLNSVIYVGKDDNSPQKFSTKEYGHGGSILLQLTEPYFNAKRYVYADNYFTSPVVAEYLLQHKTYLCGTLRSGRKHTPPAPKLKKGNVVSYCCEKENHDIQVEFWRDKRIVRMISTGQPHELVETENGRGQRKRKLHTVLQYNQQAHGIDLADMFIGYYDTARKTMKWSTKVFFRLLEMFIYNSFVMMRTMHPRLAFLDFRLNLAKHILYSTGGISFQRSNRVTRANVESVCDDRLSRRCFMDKGTTRRCVVCSKNGEQKRTIYFCKNCEVPLCAVPCFEIYYTRKSY